MEALDSATAEAVGGGVTLDSFMAALARQGAVMRNGSVMGRVDETLD